MNESRENLTNRVKLSKQNAQTLSERIRATLKEKNKSQREIAKELGISENALSNYVTGKRVPNAMLLNKIAQLCDENIQWLISGIRPQSLTEQLQAASQANIDKMTSGVVKAFLPENTTIKEEAGHEQRAASGELARERIELKQRIGSVIMLRRIKDDGGTVTVEREQFVDVLIESLDALSTAELRRLFDAIRPLLNYRERQEQERPAAG